jgi:polyhydroxyalkanoate synthase
MNEFRIDPEDARRQAEAFAARWVQGIAALAGVGEVRIGTTPKREIYREDKVVLYRYEPAADVESGKAVRTPVVICYAFVNRPYMLDLQEDRSLIRRLLAEGVDVYLIDWGCPDGAERFTTLEDYVCGYLHHCVQAAARHAGSEQVNLLGVCQGGTLSLCYTALHPQCVRNLITMVTPVDFHTGDNMLMKWGRDLDLDVLLEASGNVPGELLNLAFVSLMPFRLTSQKYLGLLDQVDDPAALENFLRMEHWIFDSPDQPGAMFRDFITQFVKSNGLIRGTAEIGGRVVYLKSLRMPLLNIFATKDHLVPPSASVPLAQLVGSSDYTEVPFNGGHIGIYVSGAAQRIIPTTIADWLRARDGVTAKADSTVTGSESRG